MAAIPRKPLTLILWGLALLALCWLGWSQVIAPRLNQDITATLGRGDYTLVSAEGETFTQDDLRGEPTAIFFGFTHCPDVCPTTLGDIATWQADLQEEGAPPLRTYFITVDPERDTPELIGDYAGWAPGVTGLSGSREEVDKAIEAFRIYARQVPLDDGGYTMDHSASILLFDRKGRFFEPIGYQEAYDRVIDKIRRLREI